MDEKGVQNQEKVSKPLSSGQSERMTNRNVNMRTNVFNSLPKFKGDKDESFDFFIQQFNDIAKIGNLPDSVKTALLKSNLIGKAHYFISNNKSIQSISDYSELVERLRKRYQPKPKYAELQANFNKIKQRPETSLQDLHDEILDKALQLTESIQGDEKASEQYVNSMTTQKFIESVKPDIGVELAKIGPENLETALECAKRIETALKMKAEAVTNINTSVNNIPSVVLEDHENNQTVQALNEIRNLIKKNNNSNTESNFNRQNNSYLNQNRIDCIICGKNNHLAANCFYNPRGRNFVNNVYNQPYRNPNQNFVRRNSTNQYVRSRFQPYHQARNSFNRGRYNNARAQHHNNRAIQYNKQSDVTQNNNSSTEKNQGNASGNV